MKSGEEKIFLRYLFSANKSISTSPNTQMFVSWQISESAVISNRGMKSKKLGIYVNGKKNYVEPHKHACEMRAFATTKDTR